MSFYSDFAGQYESIFPLEEDSYTFLRERTAPGARVLDIGCGTGDHCGRFAGDGHECVGIDSDRGMIEAARGRFPDASFATLGMEDLGALDGPFGCVYSIGNVLPHLPASKLSGFLESVARLLEPGGAWVFQTVNWDYLLGLERYRFPEVRVPEENLVFEREYPRISREGTEFVTRLRRGEELLFEGSVTLHPVESAAYVSAHDTDLFELRGHYSTWRESEFSPDEMSSSIFHFVRRGGAGPERGAEPASGAQA